MTRRQKAIAFFAKHAGYATPPGRMNCAAMLADAEHDARECGVEFRWEHDQEPDDSFALDWPARERREWFNSDHECLTCSAVLDGETLASLCGIFDPDSNYRRVIEAELASEIGEALQTIGEFI